MHVQLTSSHGLESFECKNQNNKLGEVDLAQSLENLDRRPGHGVEDGEVDAPKCEHDGNGEDGRNNRILVLVRSMALGWMKAIHGWVTPSVAMHEGVWLESSVKHFVVRLVFGLI